MQTPQFVDHQVSEDSVVFVLAFDWMRRIGSLRVLYEDFPEMTFLLLDIIHRFYVLTFA